MTIADSTLDEVAELAGEVELVLDEPAVDLAHQLPLAVVRQEWVRDDGRHRGTDPVLLDTERGPSAGQVRLPLPDELRLAVGLVMEHVECRVTEGRQPATSAACRAGGGGAEGGRRGGPGR